MVRCSVKIEPELNPFWVQEFFAARCCMEANIAHFRIWNSFSTILKRHSVRILVVSWIGFFAVAAIGVWKIDGVHWRLRPVSVAIFGDQHPRLQSTADDPLAFQMARPNRYDYIWQQQLDWYTEMIDERRSLAAANMPAPTTPAEVLTRAADVRSSFCSITGFDPSTIERSRILVRYPEPLAAGLPYRLERVIFETGLGFTIEGLLGIPGSGEGKPAVLVLNGFGTSPEQIFGLAGYKEDYYRRIGDRLCRNGFVVFAPIITSHQDFGVADLRRNLLHYLATSIGKSELVASVVDPALSAAEVMTQFPEVDVDRLFVWGCSMGGYASAYVLAFDQRYEGVVSGTNALTSWYTLTLKEYLADYPYFYFTNCLTGSSCAADLLHAVAPRRLAIEMGRLDYTGNFNEALENAKRVQAGYGLLGKKDNFEIILHSQNLYGGHELHPDQTIPLLRKWAGLAGSD